jgi:hypothetical protein
MSPLGHKACTPWMLLKDWKVGLECLLDRLETHENDPLTWNDASQSRDNTGVKRGNAFPGNNLSKAVKRAAVLTGFSALPICTISKDRWVSDGSYESAMFMRRNTHILVFTTSNGLFPRVLKQPADIPPTRLRTGVILVLPSDVTIRLYSLNHIKRKP